MSLIPNKLPTIWSTISGMGIRDQDYDESRRIIISNQIAFLGIITMLAYDAFYFFYDFFLLYKPIIVNLAGAFICVLVLYLNHLQQYRTARLCLYLCVNIQIYLLTYYLGTVTGMHLLHIMMISFALFFFIREKKSRLVVLLLLPILLFFIEYFLFTPGATPIRLDPVTVHFLYIILSITTFLLVMLFFALFYKQILRTEDLLQKEYQRSEGLLLNILPAEIANRLKTEDSTIADSHPSATILFADLAGFTNIATQLAPETLVDRLNLLFQDYDRLVEKYGLEKIKTIGDAYMVAGGVPVSSEYHLEAMASLALDMQSIVAPITMDGKPLQVRIGFHSGPVVAGVIGIRKFSYDVWGDAVNLASRLESTGVPGKIHVSEYCYKKLNHRFSFEKRGEIDVKGIGKICTYFLTGRITK